MTVFVEQSSRPHVNGLHELTRSFSQGKILVFLSTVIGKIHVYTDQYPAHVVLAYVSAYAEQSGRPHVYGLHELSPSTS